VIGLAVFFWGMVLFSGSVPRSERAAESQSTKNAASKSVELEAARKEYGAAHAALQQAQARAAAAKKAFERYVAEHFDARKPGNPLRVASKPKPRQVPKPAIQTPNPQYQELVNRLHGLRVRREQMLEQMMPEHPEVKDVDVTIHDVERRVKGTPEFLASKPAEPQSRSGVAYSAEPEEAEMQVDFEQEKKIIAGYEAARQQVADADRAVRQATLDEREKANRLDAARSLAVEQQSRSAPRDSAAHWPVLALVASVALMAGAAVALAGRRNSRVFTSAQDVEASLKIPVVAVISSSGAQVIRRGGASKLLRTAVLASEITLALFFFAVVALAVDNVTFLGDLVTDPVYGFAHGIERLRAMGPRILS